MSESLVEVRGLRYAYPDGRTAVDGVSLALASGDSLGIIGPNGAGKTTLFHLLAGLLRPQAGQVTILGKTLSPESSSSLRRRIGLVFQESESQLFSPTVLDDVAFGPLNFGMTPADARRSAREALRQVGLEGFDSRVPHHLSSGERRRVAIATVLSYHPDVLILDEPTSDLDPRGRRELVRLLSETSQSRIVASHDLEFVLRTCERVLVMDAGRVRAEGTSLEILCDSALLEEHGLETPLGIRQLKPDEVSRLLAGEETSWNASD